MLMYVIMLSIVGFLIAMFVPIGGAVIISITFAAVLLNYHKTLLLCEDMKHIKNHLGLLDPEELEEYEIKKQLKEYDELDPADIENVNNSIEKELEKDMNVEDKEK